MKNITGYRIISYILLPIAALFGFICLFMLLLAIANPAVLFPVLIMCAVVVYIILSFIFLIKAIDQLKKCKPSLRSWIKNTAYFSLFFSVIVLIQSIGLLYKPTDFSAAIDQSMAMQKSMAGMPSSEVMTSVFKGVLYFMIFFATTLLIHVYETFKFLKMYAALFEQDKIE